MYLPKHFDRSDPAWCHALIRAESFATLVTVDGVGAPFATHLPFLLDEERGHLGTLLGHMARPNPQWRHFSSPPGHGPEVAGPRPAGAKQGRPALAIFQGPHAYVSPSWYEVHPAVPTWNYVAVHAYGTPAVIEDPVRVTALLGRLTRTHEDGRPNPWRLEALTDDYMSAMIRGIVAFEMPIDRLEGKAKLSQNRGEADRGHVRDALTASGDPLDSALAKLMAAP